MLSEPDLSAYLFALRASSYDGPGLADARAALAALQLPARVQAISFENFRSALRPQPEASTWPR